MALHHAANEPPRKPQPQPVPMRPPPRPPAATLVTTVYPEPRPFAVYQNVHLLGTTALEFVVTTGSDAAGRFFPTRAFDRCRSVFTLYQVAKESNDREALREYVRQRDALGLEVYDETRRIDARVDLISLWTMQRWMIHVHTTDPRFWMRRTGH